MLKIQAISPEVQALKTLPELLQWRVQKTPGADAYRQFDTQTATWLTYSWADAGCLVSQFSRAMAAMQFSKGARIGILLPNGLDTVCADQATLALGHVPVPMHALDNPESIAFILADSAASMLIAESQKQWEAIRDAGYALPDLKQVVITAASVSSSPADAQTRISTLADWLQAAEQFPATSWPFPDEEDLAGLVYTSGTTGKPKGVMLTHRNVMANVKAVLQRVTPFESDVFLSFLPLSHTFERTAGYYTPIAGGCCVAFARSVKDLPEDMRTMQPTILVSVPRIYERVLAKIEGDVSASALKSWLFRQACAIGWKRYSQQHDGAQESNRLSLAERCLWPLLDKLIAGKLRTQFGGRLRLAVSGGAALSQHVAQTFLGLGIPVAQGYGMTETSPVIAANIPLNTDPTSVGAALEGVEVRIGDNKELQVRGPSIMRGYWNRPEDTAKVFDDGWLKTGDQAAVEASGRIRILGRVKEIIVTSTGEKIAPVDLEQAILADAGYEQVYVFGDNRPFIACSVVVTQAYWQQMQAKAGISVCAPDSEEAAKARALILKRIRELTTSFPYYAQPRGVIVTLTPWSVENSLLTPTLKLKRNNLAAHFAAQVEALYKGR